MTAKEEVQIIAGQLEALMKHEPTSASAAIVSFLRSLEKIPLDLNVLHDTNIGRIVNSIRKDTKNEEVATICKGLVRSWKGLLAVTTNGTEESKNSPATAEPEKKRVKKEENPPSGSSKAKNGQVSRSSSTSSSVSNGPATPQPTTPTVKTAPSPPKARPAQDFSNDELLETSDKDRLKSRELIAKALVKDGLPEGASDPEQIAAETEMFIFKEFKNVDAKYKQRVRSRIMSVQDAKNPKLRENILLGHIAPERLAKMTAEEMASKEMKELRDRLSKEAINDSQLTTAGGTETDLLQCGKCKQRKCTYNQVQTRSADEPMTTFVYCNNCGNRWKFC
ncbi:hypothetical protein RvY_01826 [Ramazzottius varieornatus]|uniref:Transcription elongation factor n=1 Tax=Ramazzottius varieornatus TaxID=947166 RepID=A0A1D1UHU6_RAMVA|nr:hypothetical protein RvY_01826 [Ramazzottius varieornatus]